MDLELNTQAGANTSCV